MFSVYVQRCAAGYQDSKIGTTCGEMGHGGRRLTQGGKKKKIKAAGKGPDKAPRPPDRKPRFADPARTRDRNQAHILTQQQVLDGSDFFFPPHKPGSL